MKSRIYVLLIAAIIYFLPFLVSVLRGRKNAKRVFLLNLALGWTVVAWVWLLLRTETTQEEPARFLRELDKIKSEHARKLLQRLAQLRDVKETTELIDRLGEGLNRAAICKANIEETVRSKLDEGEFTAERFLGTCDSAFQQMLLRVQYLSNQLATHHVGASKTTKTVEQEVSEVEHLVEHFVEFGQLLSRVDIEDGTPLQPVEEVIKELEDISNKAKRLRELS